MMKSTFWAVVLVCLAGLLTACGGGTKAGAAASSTTATTYAITLVLQDANGVSASQVSAGTQAIAKASVTQTVTVTASNGHISSVNSGPAPGVIVTFTTSGATLVPASGTTLTDSNGNAQVVLNVGSTAGAYTLSAATGGSTATTNYLVNNALQPQLTLFLEDENGNPTQSIQAGTIATVKVLAQDLVVVVGQTGGTLQPAANVLVTVSTDGGIFDPTTGQVLTDATGTATVRFQPNLVDGGYSMSAAATVNGSTVNTVANYQITVPQVFLGSGNPFQQGVLQILPTTVVSGTPANVSVELVDATGNPSTLPVQIDFGSGCADAGDAVIASPIPALNGGASTQYTPEQGCLGVDTIRATALLPGQSIPVTASGTITVEPAPPGGLSFVSVVPASIALNGRASATVPDQSTATFKVVSVNGIGVPGQQVNFNTTSKAGGISLENATGVSDNAGNVTTVLTAGSVPGTVEVTAQLASGAGLTAYSAPILISSGVPEQSGFSLSATTLNLEGGNIDGATSTLTIRAADHYGNPVPDGTQVSFTSDGGSIPPSCNTTSGVCSVALTSQNPRPANGRVVILATSPGDETFTDTNGNGLYDPGEPFQDLPEPWRDDNENGKYDPGEFYIDVNGNGKWDGPNGIYDGSLCNTKDPGYTCNPKGTYVRQQIVIVFSTSKANISVAPASINVDDVTPLNLHISVADLNGNLPPEGTTVVITTSNGILLDPTAYTIGNSDAKGPLVLTNAIIGDGTPSTGTLLVTLTTPSGAVSTAQAQVTDTHKTVTASALALNPPNTTIGANYNATVQTQAVVTGNTTPPGPLAGVTPVINCATGNSTGLELTPPSMIQPTDSTGTTEISIGAATGPTVSGSATCTVNVGSQSAVFTINLM